MAGMSEKPWNGKGVNNFKNLVKKSKVRVRNMDRADIQSAFLPPPLFFAVDYELFLRTVMSAIEAGVTIGDFGTVTDAYVMLESVLDKEYMRSLLELKEEVKRTKGIEKFVLALVPAQKS